MKPKSRAQIYRKALSNRQKCRWRLI